MKSCTTAVNYSSGRNGINNIIVIQPGFQLLTEVFSWKRIVVSPNKIVLIDSITLLFDLEINPDKGLRETAPF